ncbi:transglycosylase SLT domain-containing protein [Streptomyces sp. NPDC005573]|uniref:transglycosylase SLT domain-containing protein n=1 Tax=unclassified Streptomyces TaxID=2593676 RepID=UPI0033A32C2B
MPENILSRLHRRGRPMTKHQKTALAGVSVLGAAAIALSAVPGHTGTATTGSTAAPAAASVQYQGAPVKAVKGTLTDQLAARTVKLDTIEAHTKADAKKVTEVRTEQAASRSAVRLPMQTVAAKTYSNSLDGWIRHSLDIMHAKGIPGSYSGLHRNIMRESSGNPMAINGWDINAINGIPSKGLLQVIQPTFNTYHVSGTSWNIYDPVANITAAANYAAHRYGSIDNVNSAY